MVRSLILILLLFSCASAIADANDGEHLGFKLGERYSMPGRSHPKQHVMGALIYVIDPHRVHQHTGSLSIYVSPESSVIGSIFGGWYFSNKRSAQAFADHYLESLEAKYSHWKRRRNSLTNGEFQMWVDWEQRPPIVDHWPSPKPFRVSVALTFAPDSARREAWVTTIAREVSANHL